MQHIKLSTRRLRDGEVLDLDGLRLRMAGDGEVRSGDLYVAERNTGPKLLTAKKINRDGGWVVSSEGAYPFDIYECVRVEEAP